MISRTFLLATSLCINNKFPSFAVISHFKSSFSCHPNLFSFPWNKESHGVLLVKKKKKSLKNQTKLKILFTVFCFIFKDFINTSILKESTTPILPHLRKCSQFFLILIGPWSVFHRSVRTIRTTSFLYQQRFCQISLSVALLSHELSLKCCLGLA